MEVAWKCTRSGFDGGAADAALFQLTTVPAYDGDEEQRELRELPHPCPLRGVMAARARPGLPLSEVLPLGAVTEEKEHRISVVEFLARGIGLPVRRSAHPSAASPRVLEAGVRQ